MTATVLVVDDEHDIRETVRGILEDEGHSVYTAEDTASARRLRHEHVPDLVLLDIWMPGEDGITLLKEWAADGRLPCPIVMMSGHGTVETAVEATRLGAFDFLEKPLTMKRLLMTVERALEAGAAGAEFAASRRGGQAVLEPAGRSATIQRLREQMRRIAQHDTPVLLYGEAGAGKQTFARYLHLHSARREQPFVDFSVNASGQGVEEELFGSGRRAGKLEQAGGGVLYLADIGELSLAVQARLNAAIDEGSFTRTGGGEPLALNMRIVAATRLVLEQEVEQGRFMEDLYYALNVVPVEIPPLRAHREDVPDLLQFYVDWFVEHDDLPYRRFGVAAQNLRNHHWPGNVLELRNLVQRLLILAAGEEISVDEVRTAVGDAPPDVPAHEQSVSISMDLPLRDAREQFERAYLEYQLEKNAGSVAKMAAAVGMERTHLYRKLRSLGIAIK